MKILLVDYSDSYRESLKGFFIQKNCEVIEANEGIEGFELAALHKPDIIISGGLMPNMDGFEFLKNTKKSERLRSIPFIFSSGFYTSSGEKEFVLSVGADAFVPKPIEPKELWNKILIVMAESKDKSPEKISPLSHFENDYFQKHNRILLNKLIGFQSKLDFKQKQCISLFNSIRDVIVISDVERCIIDANQPATKEVFGYDNDEIIGKNARILFADDEGYHYTGREVYDAKHYVRGRVLQVNYKRKNGETFPAEVYALKLVDENGSFVGNLGVIRDITERKEAEEKLKKSMNFYLSLFENFPAMIWRSGIDGKCNYFNKNWLNFTGRTLEQELGDGWAEGVHPDDLEKCLNIYLDSFRRRESFEMQYRLKRYDGEFGWINDIGRPYYDLEGIFAGYIGSCYDITDRKKMEESLIKREMQYKSLYEQFNALLDAMPDRITLISPEWKVLWANEFSLRYLNKEKEDVIGRECFNLWHNRTEICNVCAVRDSFQTGNPSNISITTPDKKIWDVRTFPLKNSRGETTSVISISRDISEQKKLEEQLRQSQKMEAVGHLAGGIAHDFNNILTAMVGYASLIQMKTVEYDPARHYADLILSLTEKAANLTQGLLAFSRKQIINIKPANINDIIRNFEKILSRVIREDIELRTSLSDKELVSMVDAAQIEHILMNLASNASDAMPDGGVLTINTELVNIDSEYCKAHGYGKLGDYVLISIEDTGVGMDQYARERIFEPFFTTKEVGKGTGLGLAIVYGTIKQHQGYINVYSEPGKGTTFKIYLRAVQAIPSKLKPQTNEALRGGKETILLAEDDTEVRKGIKSLLENYGYIIIEAIDGDEAVRLFKENKDNIEFLLIDVIMPKINGREAYNEMRKIEPGLKAIFMSGYTANIIHTKGILDEGINFIPKPITPKELLKKIRDVIDGV